MHKDIEKEQNQKQLENLAYTGGPSRSMNYGKNPVFFFFIASFNYILFKVTCDRHDDE